MGLFRKPAEPAAPNPNTDFLLAANEGLEADNERLSADNVQLRAHVTLLSEMLNQRRDVAAMLMVRDHELAIVRAENARLQAHFDWLASHVNAITMERGVLFDKVLNVTFPAVPIIARELPGADPAYRPTAPAGDVVKTHPDPALGDILAKARDIQDAVRRGPIDQDGPLGLSFDDMGDEAAARAGISHAADGTIVTR
jgi:hypothetical protein